MTDMFRGPVKIRVKKVDREQIKLKVLNVDGSIGRTHPARAIWEFVGRQNLEPFYDGIKTVEGMGGREPWDPRMMITIWTYAYSRGISSAREISRLCRYDPAFGWITGDEVVNHHSLSDFRTGNGQALRRLFIEVLGAMSSEGLITITRVMQDGTKIEANASSGSFRREGTIKKHLEKAQEQVKRMEELSDEEIGKKRKARKVASAKERERRFEKALLELDKVRAGKKTEEEKEEARVSISDPDSRLMKHANGGYEPSYNAQISTDAENKIIVGVSLTQSGSDMHQLDGALMEIEANTEKLPAEMVMDGGYMSGPNIEKLSKQGIELYGPIVDNDSKAVNLSGIRNKKLGIAEEFLAEAFNYSEETDNFTCPAGKRLGYVYSYVDGLTRYYTYRARLKDCQSCPFKEKCCPTNKTQGRSVSRKEILPEVKIFTEKMKTEQAKEIYKQRSSVAEFPNLWIKEKLKVRRFRLRGLAKTGIEIMWAALTYNIQQWIRLSATKPTVVLT